jgi:probable DNA metabolism protein
MGGIYCYDGTFAGLLTALAHLLPRQILPETICVEPPQQQGLFAEITDIATDEDGAEEFRDELTRKLPTSGIHQMRLAFLSDRPERELLICRYCLLAWQTGKKIGGMLTHPDVAPLWKLAQLVGREAHRFLGFVRFQEVTGGFYYAAISPDHRILPIIASHFAARFSDQDWVIHDIRHGEGILFDRGQRQWLLLPMETHAKPDVTPAEEQFQALWREYFATLAITERKNTKLQQSKVPLKVRPWLMEFQEAGKNQPS